MKHETKQTNKQTNNKKQKTKKQKNKKQKTKYKKQKKQKTKTKQKQNKKITFVLAKTAVFGYPSLRHEIGTEE